MPSQSDWGPAMPEAQSWPPRVPDREDRESPVASWPPPTASSDREDDREFPAGASRPGADREGGGPRVRIVKPIGRTDLAVTDEADEWADEPHSPVFLTWIQEWRFVRDTTTTIDFVDYAINGAYALPDGDPWSWNWVNRRAHIAFAYTIGLVGALLCDGIKWAFFMRLSRTLIAIPVTLALGWAINHIPVTAWLTPDGWDISTWWADPPAIVEVPIEAPIGEG
jgi:hypothetical protein